MMTDRAAAVALLSRPFHIARFTSPPFVRVVVKATFHLNPDNITPHPPPVKDFQDFGRYRIGGIIMTTRIAGGLLLGCNPRDAGQRPKALAFTLFRPDCL